MGEVADGCLATVLPLRVAAEIVKREHGSEGRSSLIRRGCCSQAVISRAAEAAAVAARTASHCGCGPAVPRQPARGSLRF